MILLNPIVFSVIILVVLCLFKLNVLMALLISAIGPTAGLNADGQHDHIWDTCVPTALAYNIPIAIAAILLSSFVL